MGVRLFPSNQPLTNDGLTGGRHLFQPSVDTAATIVAGQSVRANLLKLCIAFDLGNLPHARVDRVH
jgi:hypothetical protein